MDRRRVVVFGSSNSGLAEHLVERGARLVHVYDPELSRVSEAAARGMSQDISFAPLGQSGIAVRDGAFDMGIIDDLGAADAPDEVLRRFARALSPRGVALIATQNRDVRPAFGAGESESSSGGLSYYDLYDKVAEHFEEVRMLGQVPFAGYAIADFSPDREPEISVDTALVPTGSEEPEWYVALAGHQPVMGDAFAIIQAPCAELFGPRPLALGGSKKQSRELEEATERVATLEAELSKARAQKPAQESSHKLADADKKIASLKAELEKRDGWLKQLEDRAATADERADNAAAELDKLKKQRSREAAAGDDKQREALEAKLESERSKFQAAERELAELRGERAATQKDDVAKLEALLTERGQRIADLERELEAALQTGRDLARELKDLKTEGESAVEPNASSDEISHQLTQLQQKLDNLAAANAERQAELIAADWTIQKLREEAARAPAASLERELEQARATIHEQETLLKQIQDKKQETAAPVH